MFKNAPPTAKPDASSIRVCPGCGTGHLHWYRRPGMVGDPVYIEDFCSPACAVATCLRGKWHDGQPLASYAA